jgi:hypothetical protein
MVILLSGVKVDEINGVPVYCSGGKFVIKKDGVELSSPTLAGLKTKVAGTDKNPTKVIHFSVYVGGGYEEKLQVFGATSPAKSIVFRIDEQGKKHRIGSDDLFVHTPQLEAKLASLLQKAKDLRNEITATLGEAKRFP